MGNTRKELDDDVYQKRRNYYLKRRDKILAKAKITYQMEREVRLKTAKQIRDAAKATINQMSTAEREAAELEAVQALEAGPIRAAGFRRRGHAQQFVKDFKAGKSCHDCHNSFPPYVLDFDHVHGTKVAAISDLVAKGRSLEAINSEVQKCELVCANCHRIRTFKRRNDLF